MEHPFDAVTEAQLRRRQSAKWRHYPPDVLPAWLAEMDFPLAAPIRAALSDALAADDCGYAFPGALPEAFASWAKAHYGWNVGARDVFLVPDVGTGIGHLLEVGTKPGDGVVIEPPIYPPFTALIREHGRVVVEAPLARSGGAYAVDLEAIERAYANGARAHMFCSPHNPAGLVHSRETLMKVAELADRYGVLVLSDEIHAPLTLPGATFTPFPVVSEAAARRSLVLVSPSKPWNLAGLKSALVVASSPEMRAVAAKIPPLTPYHAGHFGVLAARAAYAEGDAWLESTIAILDRNRALLADLLREHLPAVRYRPPEAGYLAWLDCRELGLSRDPAQVFLERGRVALSSGPTFGVGGEGHARINIATTRALLEEAVRRMARAVAAE